MEHFDITNFTVCSNSKLCSSGVFFKIKTMKFYAYTYKISATLIKGDEAFVYCEDDRGRCIVPRTNENKFYLNKHKKLEFPINGQDKNINFGILFSNSDIEYELKIDSICVLNENDNLLTIDNMVLHKSAFLKVDGQIISDISLYQKAKPVEKKEFSNSFKNNLNLKTAQKIELGTTSKIGTINSKTDLKNIKKIELDATLKNGTINNSKIELKNMQKMELNKTPKIGINGSKIDFKKITNQTHKQQENSTNSNTNSINTKEIEDKIKQKLENELKIKMEKQLKILLDTSKINSIAQEKRKPQIIKTIYPDNRVNSSTTSHPPTVVIPETATQTTSTIIIPEKQEPQQNEKKNSNDAIDKITTPEVDLIDFSDDFVVDNSNNLNNIHFFDNDIIPISQPTNSFKNNITSSKYLSLYEKIESYINDTNININIELATEKIMDTLKNIHELNSTEHPNKILKSEPTQLLSFVLHKDSVLPNMDFEKISDFTNVNIINDKIKNSASEYVCFSKNIINIDTTQMNIIHQQLDSKHDYYYSGYTNEKKIVTCEYSCIDDILTKWQSYGILILKKDFVNKIGTFNDNTNSHEFEYMLRCNQHGKGMYINIDANVNYQQIDAYNDRPSKKAISLFYKNIRIHNDCKTIIFMSNDKYKIYPSKICHVCNLVSKLNKYNIVYVEESNNNTYYANNTLVISKNIYSYIKKYFNNNFTITTQDINNILPVTAIKKMEIVPKSSDIPTTKNKVLCYYGKVDEKLDYDLIRRICDTKKYLLLMIGQINKIHTFSHPNIKWIPHVDYELLRGYLDYVDIIIFPYIDLSYIPNKYYECYDKIVIGTFTISGNNNYHEIKNIDIKNIDTICKYKSTMEPIFIDDYLKEITNKIEE